MTHVNGRAVTDMESLVESLRPLEAGDSVALEVLRLGRRLEIGYRLPERPFLPGEMPELQPPAASSKSALSRIGSRFWAAKASVKRIGRSGTSPSPSSNRTRSASYICHLESR